jgi:hypothetical protein
VIDIKDDVVESLETVSQRIETAVQTLGWGETRDSFHGAKEAILFRTSSFIQLIPAIPAAPEATTSPILALFIPPSAKTGMVTALAADSSVGKPSSVARDALEIGRRTGANRT